MLYKAFPTALKEATSSSFLEQRFSGSLCDILSQFDFRTSIYHRP